MIKECETQGNSKKNIRLKWTAVCLTLDYLTGNVTISPLIISPLTHGQGNWECLNLSHPWLSRWQRKLFESISPLNISPLIISPWTISLATFIVWNYFTFYITLYLTGNVILRSDWNYLTLYLTVKVIESVSHSLLLCFFPLSLAVLLFIFNFQL